MGTPELAAAIAHPAECNYKSLLHIMTPFLPTWAAQPENIADAVRWLASDQSKLSTAQTISVEQNSSPVG
ncbi:hypothetical protein [Mycobacterium sp. E796]|uniref:hypothetical protein n=1 Tax=Mycobacterium sp. E796 TaxID=1834151 RepID=UPI0007FC38F1|nr:hypothetical protein [Mycobacterium sp. E796]OBI43998.1 hypothetical protein A5706_03875 [Mycobacterium sp. E796]